MCGKRSYRETTQTGAKNKKIRLTLAHDHLQRKGRHGTHVTLQRRERERERYRNYENGVNTEENEST